jgi:hypothetical protein
VSAAPPDHLSFGAQALRYFDRPHEGVPAAPVGGPSAWRGPDLARRDDWIVRLTAADVAELDAAIAVAAGRGPDLRRVRREDFPLPTLAPRIAAWTRELADGRGFLLLRGLPVARWGDERSALVFWGLGRHLGEPGAQNPDDDLLGHVTDMGEETSNPFVRRYRTAGDIAYHCDLADVVGLLCLRAAARGGASRIVSSTSVFDALLAERPDLVPRLFAPFRLDTRDETGGGGPKWVDVPPCRYAGGRLRTFYHSDYFRSVVRHAEVPPFSDQERALLDRYEAIAASPDFYLDMHFEPGDVQLISNHSVLHARTAYEDGPGPARRHLLRLWLSLRR